MYSIRIEEKGLVQIIEHLNDVTDGNGGVTKAVGKAL